MSKFQNVILELRLKLNAKTTDDLIVPRKLIKSYTKESHKLLLNQKAFTLSRINLQSEND